MNSRYLIVSVLLLWAVVSCSKSDKKNQQPFCEIVSPANGQTFEQNEEIAIIVNASDEDGIITGVSISVDEEIISNLTEPPYEYNWNTESVSSGDYSISASCSDDDGSTYTDEILIEIEFIDTTLNAKFSASPTNGTPPLTVNFTDESTGSPNSWAWSFGDGTSSTLQNPSHIYTSQGEYTVALTVVGNYGNDTEVEMNYIVVGSAGNDPPVADFIASPLSGSVPLTVNFTDQSTNNPTSWQWDFGNGNSSTQQNPSHTYTAVGTYTVSLTVNNSYGSDSETKNSFIEVSNSSTSGQPCPGVPTITDYDGNQYNTVQIGNQCWMKENLQTTHYRNGTSIANITDDNAWENLSNGAYVLYTNNIFWDDYGFLYNWFATVDPNGLCPAGWHVPTNNEWIALTNYIGGTDEPHGNELKSCRQLNSPLGGDCDTNVEPYWKESYSAYGTDDYGFSGLPGGYRDDDGDFDYIGGYGGWWSSTEYSPIYAWFRGLTYTDGKVSVHNDTKKWGLSVRCLKD
jgi:uncharacterized protein (TIGR02145 family)